MAINNGALRKFPAMIIIIGLLCSLTASAQDKQTTEQLVAKLGRGFVSNTAKVNGTTLHYVRGGNGPAIINHLKMPNIHHELLIGAPAEKITMQSPARKVISLVDSRRKLKTRG